MRPITLEDLKKEFAGRPLPASLYHPWGWLLHDIGEAIQPEWLELLADGAFEQFCFVEKREEVEELVRNRSGKPVRAEDLKAGMRLLQPVHDAVGNLLLGAGQDVPPALLDKIRELQLMGTRAFFRIERPAEEIRPVQEKIDQYHERVFSLADLRVRAKVLAEKLVREGPPVSKRDLESDDNAFDVPALETRREDALKNRMRDAKKGKKRAEAVQKSYLEIYHDLLRRTEKLFLLIHRKEPIEGVEFAELSAEVVEALVEDRDLLLNLTNLKREADYLINHAVNVSILSANIAAELELSHEQVVEVGFAALLSDIGMMFVPEEIRNKKGKLSEEERQEVFRHPSHGIDSLEHITGIPRTTPFVVYQSHERVDRSGYPKKRPGHLISRYAQIVAVADVYDALTSDRPYRDALLPYQAMETIVRLVNSQKFDKTVVRGFLACMSLFPIGSWVKLEDGTVAKVVAANATNFSRPIVVPFLKDGQRFLADPIDLLAPAEKSRKITESVASPLKTSDLMTGF